MEDNRFDVRISVLEETVKNHAEKMDSLERMLERHIETESLILVEIKELIKNSTVPLAETLEKQDARLDEIYEKLHITRGFFKAIAVLAALISTLFGLYKAKLF